MQPAHKGAARRFAGAEATARAPVDQRADFDELEMPMSNRFDSRAASRADSGKLSTSEQVDISVFELPRRSCRHSVPPACQQTGESYVPT
jgi:hypothetical protein